MQTRVKRWCLGRVVCDLMHHCVEPGARARLQDFIRHWSCLRYCEIFLFLNTSIAQQFLDRQIRLLIPKPTAKLHHIRLLETRFFKRLLLLKDFLCSSICKHRSMRHDNHALEILCDEIHIMKNRNRCGSSRKLSDS